MLELLFAILEMLLELFLEAALEFVLAFIISIIWRGVAAVLEFAESENSLLACISYLFLGGVMGGVSLLLFPHPLVHPSRFHGISVIVSPVLAGLGMSLVGSALRKRNKKVMKLQSFGYGFTFALGMALVRFLLISKS
jgi:hypothetical protein